MNAPVRNGWALLSQVFSGPIRDVPVQLEAVTQDQPADTVYAVRLQFAGACGIRPFERLVVGADDLRLLAIAFYRLHVYPGVSPVSGEPAAVAELIAASARTDISAQSDLRSYGAFWWSSPRLTRVTSESAKIWDWQNPEAADEPNPNPYYVVWARRGLEIPANYRQ